MDLDGDYNYYSIEIKTAAYFRYVDSLTKTSAEFMGIEDEECADNRSCFNMNWSEYNEGGGFNYSIFENVLGEARGVAFVFDPTGSVSDTISNSTTESQFQSIFSNFSSQARELEFVMGYSGSEAYNILNSSDFKEESDNGVSGFGADILSKDFGRVASRLTTWAKNTAHGMNIRFPEIWSDSSNQRSYDCEMHFIAPYATNFCKWRYALVPFFHVFCLAAPKSNTNSSQYSAPFIIRAFSKGYFNVELGMIESLTWKRFGEGDMISSDGIPMQIDVTISFKDLYHVLMMTNMYSADEEGTSMLANLDNFYINGYAWYIVWY